MKKVKEDKKKPDEETNVKMSVCAKCEGAIRMAVEHMMTNKDKKEFALEVLEHNLSIKQIPLLEYRKLEIDFCKCCK